MHLNIFQGNHKDFSKLQHYLFYYYWLWDFTIIIIIYFIASICSLRTVMTKKKAAAVFRIMTRLSRCYAWNTSPVTFLVMFPTIWNIQIFLCHLQCFWVLRALLSATAAQKRSHHMGCNLGCNLPDSIFCSNPRHLGSSWDFFSSCVPVPQTRKIGRKEKSCINL